MKKIIISLIIFIFATQTSSAQDLEKQKRFAQELFEKGEYYRAITEYYRINSYFPDNPDFLKNYVRIATCYSLADHLLESNEVYNKVLEFDSLNWNAVFNIANNFRRISYYDESRCNSHS